MEEYLSFYLFLLSPFYLIVTLATSCKGQSLKFKSTHFKQISLIISKQSAMPLNIKLVKKKKSHKNPMNVSYVTNISILNTNFEDEDAGDQ